MKRTLLSVWGASALLAAGMANASDFPQRNIDFIVPWSAGGGADNVVRALQPSLEEALGTTIVVRNIAGGGGAVGFSRAVASQPDGYTVTIPTNATFTLEGLGNVSFTRDDFDFIARVLVAPYVLAVRPNDEWRDLEGLIESAEQRDGPLQIGASGVGSSTHIMALMLAGELGIDISVVPFNSGSEAVSAAMGGHIDGVVLNPSEVLPAINSDRLTPIVTTGEERSGVLSDTPTMREAGYDFAISQWRGIAGPAGLDPEVERRWVEAVKQAVEDPDFQQAARNLGTDIRPLYGDELDAFIEQTSGPLIEQASNIQQ